MRSIRDFYTQRIKRRFVRHLNNWRIFQMARRVASRAPASKGRPIIFFKASSGLDDFSWNSAFHLLVSWGLRLQGVPVLFFACRAGMSRCVLGTDRRRPDRLPPCRSCVYQSRTLYTGAQVHGFTFARNAGHTDGAVKQQTLAEAIEYIWQGYPIQK